MAVGSHLSPMPQIFHQLGWLAAGKWLDLIDCLRLLIGQLQGEEARPLGV